MTSKKKIYIMNPTTIWCSECESGIERSIFKVSQKKWKKIGKRLKTCSDCKIEMDFSSGGHGCILFFDLQQIYDDCIVIEKISRSVYKVFKSNYVLELLSQFDQDQSD